jgi:hypothetical protein
VLALRFVSILAPGFYILIFASIALHVESSMALFCGTQRTASELFFPTQGTNVRHQGVNLGLAERILEGRHSGLAVGNYLSEFCIGQLLDCL